MLIFVSRGLWWNSFPLDIERNSITFRRLERIWHSIGTDLRNVLFLRVLSVHLVITVVNSKAVTKSPEIFRLLIDPTTIVHPNTSKLFYSSFDGAISALCKRPSWHAICRSTSTNNSRGCCCWHTYCNTLLWTSFDIWHSVPSIGIEKRSQRLWYNFLISWIR